MHTALPLALITPRFPAVSLVFNTKRRAAIPFSRYIDRLFEVVYHTWSSPSAMHTREAIFAQSGVVERYTGLLEEGRRSMLLPRELGSLTFKGGSTSVAVYQLPGSCQRSTRREKYCWG